jgi:plastocyanin
MTDLFYVFGIALTVAALIVSFVGLRSERFPGSRGLLAAVVAFMGALVVASCAFAVALAREESKHREEEVAEFQAEQEEAEEAAAAEQGEAEEGATPTGSEPPIETEAKAQTLELTSPADGGLVFEPDELEARTGEVTIEYTNPSEVPHNVAIEGGGAEIAQGPTVTGGDSGAATAALESGEYAFFCSIPGHREAGMEGVLTVE